MDSDEPLLKAISARFCCIEELLVMHGDIKGSLAIIEKCKKILPKPDKVNIEAARLEAGNGNV